MSLTKRHGVNWRERRCISDLYIKQREKVRIKDGLTEGEVFRGKR
ncbi:MAG: hypothetical protein ACEY3A_03195 [Wolbachia sp.]